MAKENKSQYAILGILKEVSGSATGYDIKKTCDDSIAYFWNENYGHIYPVLKRLEKQGLVNKKIEKTTNKRDKKIYSITDAGEKSLLDWLLLPIDNETIRSELLLKIFLANDLPIANLIEKIEKRKLQAEKNITEYQKIEKKLQEISSDLKDKKLMLWLSTLSYGKHTEKATIDWCLETINKLSELGAMKKQLLREEE